MRINKVFRLFFFAFLFIGCSEDVTEISFPSDIETIYSGKELCVDCKGTVVLYLDGTRHSLHVFTDNSFNWTEYSLAYPIIDFKIYLGNKLPKGYSSLSEVKDFFIKREFPYSIYWDPENIFFESNRLEYVEYENKTFQIYLVSENKILSDYDIGFPSLRKSQLLEFFDVSPLEIKPSGQNPFI
jgi:hypothetical protein